MNDIEFNIIAHIANLNNKIDNYYHNIMNELAIVKNNMSALKTNSALMSSGIVIRNKRMQELQDTAVVELSKRHVVDLDQQFHNLSVANPALFEVWIQLFYNGKKAYETSKKGSCSDIGSEYSKLFGYFLENYASGTILDIGIGPHGIPSYLFYYPSNNIYGVEPLEQIGDLNNQICKGLNEYLPWDDNKFDTVVSGTSLDHVFSLDKSLSEVKRVLKPDGCYLIWLASLPGAPAFDENSDKFEAIDDYHLFHFERSWIEPIFEKYFDIHDLTIVPQLGFDHVFYCLKQKK